MARDWTEAALAGTRLTKEEAEALESLLAERPGDVEARVRLIGYLTGPSIFDEALALKRLDQILWLLDHDPENDLLGSPFCAAFDPAGLSYLRIGDRWKELVRSKDAGAAILLNASRFFDLSDPDLARELLERGEREHPSRPEWAEHLGTSLLRQVEVPQHLEALGRKPEQSPEALKEASLESLGHLERALRLTFAAGGRLTLLSRCARSALAAGRREAAVRYADETIAAAQALPGEAHRHDYLHQAHVVRGHVALDSGNMSSACRELGLAGSQGLHQAPVLHSFGPDFRLARRLLERGETAAVLAYLDQVAGFWKPDRVAGWKADIEGGGVPLMFNGPVPKPPS